jgi:superoxide reductase
MTKLNQIWKCEVCGNVIELVHFGADSLVCCGQPMVEQEAKGKDQEGNEKHVPVFKKVDGGAFVKVGDVPHPMEEDHYIEWVELVSDKWNGKVFLKPGEKSEATFFYKGGGEVIARTYCNKHGLWKSE